MTSLNMVSLGCMRFFKVLMPINITKTSYKLSWEDKLCIDMKTIMTGEVLAYVKHCILCKLILNIHISDFKLFLTLLVIRGVTVSYRLLGTRPLVSFCLMQNTELYMHFPAICTPFWFLLLFITHPVRLCKYIELVPTHLHAIIVNTVSYAYS